MEDKKELRNEGKHLLKAFSEKERQMYANIIAGHLFKTTYWQNAHRIGITVARTTELPTKPIIHKAWELEKEVSIPKCYPDQDHKMLFYHYTPQSKLQNTYLDLFEPNDKVERLIPKESIDLIIVPGLLFDYDGYRIGYGGGYYDRYLQKFTGETIALATNKQIQRSLPHDQFDIPVHHVITETGLLF
ncbi:5-formyltetrahydrofolate cyclo-ligase [Salirhabdus salicampi]|uniref:5-formyltetrahydrofolate cyclo-ligase n=1 Tax=Salirhabdus salicampi TaxID=476102 RepID=UPI0020C4CB7F|nr:5-formyltetrahydrofolate cyclo-ligase [Salirhabdus salicampi]MCP8616864.1 5-formyltetrahydrofolate cyclo-ligase [Salirhabdus salicampi]